MKKVIVLNQKQIRMISFYDLGVVSVFVDSIAIELVYYLKPFLF